MSVSGWQGHALANRLQSLLLVVLLLCIRALAGYLLFGDTGLWLAGFVALLIGPAAEQRWRMPPRPDSSALRPPRWYPGGIWR